ncbi:ROK family protein [bacterium]|nr:ROK family protein [candidate division CSSED10-310 bacterium]
MKKNTENISGALPYTLKEKNRKIVLKLLHSGGAFSLAEISAIVGLSRQTVTKIIDYYLDKNLVCSTGKGESTDIGGKKPKLFKFSSDTKLLCISIGYKKTRVLVLDLQANIHDSVEIRDTHTLSYEMLKNRIMENCSILYQNNPRLKKQIKGVSCSIPGIVEYISGTLRYNIFSSEWGYDIPLKKDLHTMFPMADYVYVDNVGRMIGRSLLWIPNENISQERIVAIYTSVGISACQIANGKIENGANSLIGEIGHMILEPMDHEVCLCGSRGCFEVLASIERARKLVAEKINEFPESPLNQIDPEQISFHDIFEGSRKGDVLCRHIIEFLAKWFGLAMRNIDLTIDPTMIIFFGGFSYADDFFDRKLHEVLNDFHYYPKTDKCKFVYDKRNCFELETIGSAQSLVESFLSNEDLYR